MISISQFAFLQADTKEQLKNLQNIQLYNYRYTEEFADAVGLDDPNQIETGVIAQELEVVIPEAVKTTTDVHLPTGEVIDQLKVVDKVSEPLPDSSGLLLVTGHHSGQFILCNIQKGSRLRISYYDVVILSLMWFNMNGQLKVKTII